MFWLQIAWIVGLSVVLMKATDVVVAALHGLANRTKLGTFGVAAILAAVATSFPEIIVGILAALEGKPELSLGNVIGSNIADLSVIIGLAALVGGSVGVVGDFLRRDFFTAFLVGAVPLLLLIDGRLSRADGLGLLAVYLIYSLATVWEQRAYRSKRGFRWGKVWQKVEDWETDKQFGWLLAGAVVMVVAANLLVKTTSDLAVALKIPGFLVGLFIVALGTSLPELVFEIEAIRKKEIGMVYGNLLGSVAANSTLALGLTVVIAPLQLGRGVRPYLLATIVFVIVFGIFWWLVRSKKRLDRWEGALLVAVYGVFVWLEFLKQ